MKNKWKTTAIIFIIISALLFILYTLTIVGSIVIDAEHEDSIQQWCEIANDDADLINDLIDSLEYYDEEWVDVERLEKVNCFE